MEKIPVRSDPMLIFLSGNRSLPICKSETRAMGPTGRSTLFYVDDNQFVETRYEQPVSVLLEQFVTHLLPLSSS